MKQIDGDRNFIAPALKLAAIFGGIAGIMNAQEGEGCEADGPGQLPSLASQKARDVGELQDIYRQSLAASWASQIHELPADKCIEDIFAGGDGWGNVTTPPVINARGLRVEDALKRGHGPGPRRGTYIRANGHSRNGSYEASQRNGVIGKNKSDLNIQTSSSEDQAHVSKDRSHDVSEYDLREDMRSWEIRSR